MDATYEELERNDIKGPQEAEQLTHAYAGFWVRFWAFLLDWLVVWGLNHLLVSPLYRNGSAEIIRHVYLLGLQCDNAYCLSCLFRTNDKIL